MTTTMSQRTMRWLAVVAAFAVAVFGLAAIPAPANAAGPKITVTEAPAGGGEVTVKGEGFDANEIGIYFGVGEKGYDGF